MKNPAAPAFWQIAQQGDVPGRTFDRTDLRKNDSFGAEIQGRPHPSFVAAGHRACLSSR
jgi:hypothetical protein